MEGLIKRGGVYIYRRVIPQRLRSILGKREWKESLATNDLKAAQRRWKEVHERVEQVFREAEVGVKSPSIAAYKAVEAWRQERAQRPPDPNEEEGLDLHITTLLERSNLDPHQRAVLEALLKRDEADGADNPPLSILFDRYYAERKLPAKTKLEWDGVLRRFTATVGDLPVRAITPAHLRSFKTALLAATSKRSGRAVSPATVQKLLNALRSVLSWAKREGYVSMNPADGITTIAKSSGEEGRLPYDAEDLKKLFSREACDARKDSPANEWLPWLALYTGARLEELGQLRTTDVRREDDVDFLAIEPGEGKRVKTKSSRRRVPLHPELVGRGFLAFVEMQRAAGHSRLFPELRSDHRWFRERITVTKVKT